MKKQTTILATIAAMLAAGLLFTGCSKEEEGTLEKAGKDADKAVAEAGEKAEETVDEAAKALEDLGN